MIAARITELRALAATGAQGKKSAAITELCDALQACQRRREKTIGPTLPDVLFHAKEIGMDLDKGSNFFDYHTARGWKMGKHATAPMRDWKAAMRLWQRNGKSEQPTPRASYGVE